MPRTARVRVEVEQRLTRWGHAIIEVDLEDGETWEDLSTCANDSWTSEDVVIDGEESDDGWITGEITPADAISTQLYQQWLGVPRAPARNSGLELIEDDHEEDE